MQFGYEPGELLGERVTTVIPAGFAQRLRSDDLRSAEDARTQETEHAQVTRSSIGHGVGCTTCRGGSRF